MASPSPLTLGFLYPGHAAEDDYPRMAALLATPARLEVVHTEMGEDAHREDALLEIGSPARLDVGAAALHERGVDAGVWACTSGSFVYGWEGAQSQADALSQVLGAPASSTSFAFVNALHALGVTRVAVAATYPVDVADRFVAFLAAAGIDVVAMGSQGIITAAEVGTLDVERTVGFVAAGDHADAEAVLVPDTALHTVALLERLETTLRKPVLTANQVTVWEALRLVGHAGTQDRLGTLFQTADPAAA